MKRIGDKAARVLLTIFGVKTTIIIGTILTFAGILIAIITGLIGTISTSGGKGGKTNAQSVTYQKDGDEEDDDEEDDDGSKPQSTSTKTDSASAGDSDPFTKGTKAYENAHKVFMAFVNAGLSGESAAGAVGQTLKGAMTSLDVPRGIMVVVSMIPFLRGLCQRQVVHLTHLVVVESSSLTPTQNMPL